MSIAGIALKPCHLPGLFNDRAGRSNSTESILIFLSVCGSLIPMRVLETDSIESVKLRIQTCKGFVVKKQKLVYGGRELARNESRVKDYGLVGGKVLRLVLKLSDLLFITVRTSCGKQFEFHVDRFQNVGYLKKRIAKKGHDFDELDDQEIYCDGERLDNQRLIDNICRDNDAAIHLLVQKSGKVKS